MVRSRECTIAGIAAIKQSDVDMLADAIRCAAITLLFGNGGSYALASHIAADITKVTKGQILTACPMDSTPGLTAWSNDASYSVACEQLAEPYMKLNPCVIAISTSGVSMNVISAARMASSIAGGYVVTNHNIEVKREASIVNLEPDVRVAENINLVFMHLVVERLEHDYR